MTERFHPIELERAFALLPLKLFGVTLEAALRDPIYGPLIESKAAADRQIRRDLARRAEQMRAGRWLAASSPMDAYEQTERTGWVSGVAA